MPVSTVQLITQSEYARRRGCTEGAVRRAVRDGRISLIDGKIDPVAADAQWARNTRVRAGSRATDDANLHAGSAAPSRGDDDDDAGYWHSKARRERAEADLAELKLAEQRAELVRAQDVYVELARVFATFRGTMQQIPYRMAAILAAETDQARVHDLLASEITAALLHLKRASEAHDG